MTTTTSKSSALQTSTAPNSAGVTRGDLDKKADEIVKETQVKVDKVVEKFESRINEKEAKTTEILAIFIKMMNNEEKERGLIEIKSILNRDFMSFSINNYNVGFYINNFCFRIKNKIYFEPSETRRARI